MFSKQLKNLENKVRKQLLIRDSKEVTLTEDSMLLRKCAEEIIDLVERTKTECSSSDKYISIDFIWEVVKWKPFLWLRKQQKSRRRERLHKEVASPFGFIISRIDWNCRKINYFGGLHNEKQNLERAEWFMVWIAGRLLFALSCTPRRRKSVYRCVGTAARTVFERASQSSVYEPIDKRKAERTPCRDRQAGWGNVFSVGKWNGKIARHHRTVKGRERLRMGAENE